MHYGANTRTLHAHRPAKSRTIDLGRVLPSEYEAEHLQHGAASTTSAAASGASAASASLEVRASCLPNLYLSLYLSIHPSIYPSIHLSIYPSIHLSIYLSIPVTLQARQARHDRRFRRSLHRWAVYMDQLTSHRLRRRLPLLPRLPARWGVEVQLTTWPEEPKLVL